MKNRCINKMSKTFSMNIRVSKEQKQVIETNAKVCGYKNVSDYMRIRSLNSVGLEEKLIKICKALFPEEDYKFKPNGVNKKLAEFT